MGVSVKINNLFPRSSCPLASWCLVSCWKRHIDFPRFNFRSEETPAPFCQDWTFATFASLPTVSWVGEPLPPRPLCLRHLFRHCCTVVCAPRPLCQRTSQLVPPPSTQLFSGFLVPPTAPVASASSDALPFFESHHVDVLSVRNPLLLIVHSTRSTVSPWSGSPMNDGTVTPTPLVHALGLGPLNCRRLWVVMVLFTMASWVW